MNDKLKALLPKRKKKPGRKKTLKRRFDDNLPLFLLASSFLVLFLLLGFLFLVLRVQNLEHRLAFVMEGGSRDQILYGTASPELDLDNNDLLNLIRNNEPVGLGDPNAPITITEFSDFECPFCKVYHDNVFSVLKEQYIDTGKVYYEFRHLPLYFHSYSYPAAETAVCAEYQGKFWEMQDLLFANLGTWNTGSSRNIFRSYAQKLEMDVNDFDLCITTNEAESRIDQDVADAIALGIEGTPTVYIGTTPVTGSQIPDDYISVIEAQLSELSTQ